MGADIGDLTGSGSGESGLQSVAAVLIIERAVVDGHEPRLRRRAPLVKLPPDTRQRHIRPQRMTRARHILAALGGVGWLVVCAIVLVSSTASSQTSPTGSAAGASHWWWTFDSSTVSAFSAAVSALFAIAIFLVYVGQLRAMKRQAAYMRDGLNVTQMAAAAAKESADAAARTLILSHRPALVIRHIVVDGIDSGTIGEGLTNGYAWVTNIGVLPATLLKVHAKWLLVKALPLENPSLQALDTTSVPLLLPPGQSCKIPLPDWDLTSLDEHGQIWPIHSSPKNWLQDERVLFLIGYIKYRDEIGVRRTYYCYRYSGELNRFIRVKHPNYNYTD